MKTARRCGGCVLAAGLLTGALTGCASAPETTRPQLRDHGAVQLVSGSAAWPAAKWWQQYGDAQLDALIEEALRDAPSIAMAQARFERALADAGLARAGRRPQLAANAVASEERMSENYLFPPAFLPDGMNDYGRLTLDFSWQIDFWGQHRALIASAVNAAEAREAELAQARLSLSAAIAQQYVELARLHDARDDAERAVELRRARAGLIEKRVARGLENRASLGDARARLAAAEEALLAADEQLQVQRYRLAALLGASPERAARIERPRLQIDHGVQLPEVIGATLLGRRPDIRAARLSAEALAQRRKAQKAEFYPNVNLAAFVGFHALGLNHLTEGGSKIAGYGPAISLPIFRGGALRAQLRGAEADYAQAVAGYNAALATALEDVATHVTQLRSIDARRARIEEAVQASEEAQRVASRRYAAGIASYLEVLNAEENLLQARSARTQLRALAIAVDIGLQRALGGGYAADATPS